MSTESDFQSILENGISFGRGGSKKKEEGKVKTKAKKKAYGRKPSTASNGTTGTSKHSQI